MSARKIIPELQQKDLMCRVIMIKDQSPNLENFINNFLHLYFAEIFVCENWGEY